MLRFEIDHFSCLKRPFFAIRIVPCNKIQASSSQNLQTIESVPGSLLAGAGKMVGTLHQVKTEKQVKTSVLLQAGASLFNRAMSFLPSTRIRRRLALATQQSKARKRNSSVGARKRDEVIRTNLKRNPAKNQIKPTE